MNAVVMQRAAMDHRHGFNVEAAARRRAAGSRHGAVFVCVCVCVFFFLFESAARKSDRILFLFFLAWGRSKLWRCFSSSSLLGACADVVPPVAVAALSFLSVLLISLSL